MRLFFILALFLLSCMEVTSTEIEKEFEAYFNVPFNKAKQEKVKIGVPVVIENSSVISVSINFDLQGAEKVLVLQPKYDGCPNMPVRVATFNLKPKYNIRSISFRAKVSCFIDEIAYYAYVKTKNGKYYFTTKKTIISYESPGL